MYDPSRPAPPPGQMAITGSGPQLGGPGGIPSAPQPINNGLPPHLQNFQQSPAFQRLNPQVQNALSALAGNPGGMMEAMQGFRNDFRGQLQDWRADRPQFRGFEGGRDAFRAALGDWRAERPTFQGFAQNYLNQQAAPASVPPMSAPNIG